MNNYEKYFEDIQNRAIQISELIKQIMQLEDLIALHQKYDSKGLVTDQYMEREFSQSLNAFLMPYNLCIKK
ncbi:MAG: hypothetical protein AAF849_01275 [Bacteroidota bacterium]